MLRATNRITGEVMTAHTDTKKAVLYSLDKRLWELKDDQDYLSIGAKNVVYRKSTIGIWVVSLDTMDPLQEPSGLCRDFLELTNLWSGTLDWTNQDPITFCDVCGLCDGSTIA